MESSATDEFYNIGTGVQTSIRDLCNLILSTTGSKLQVKFNPYSQEDARRMVQNRVGSTAKAKKDLDFAYEISLLQGIKDLISWRSKNHHEEKSS
jgi:UDP-glucose 4-epimerase